MIGGDSYRNIGAMRTKVKDNIFYVYEHWRHDKDVCFWVGKGYGNRAYDFKRNKHYNNVVAKLARLGMCVEVRLVESAMSETDALALEIERIAFWRDAGVKLTNLTDGGEGVVGLVHTPESRRKISDRLKGRIAGPHSEETKRKISEANIAAARRPGGLYGRANPAHSARLKGRSLSSEHRLRIGIGLQGHVVTEEARIKSSITQSGRKLSVEHREKLSVSHLGNIPSEHTRMKMSKAQRESYETTDRRQLAADRWKDPAYSEKMSEALSAAFNDPKRREAGVVAAKKGGHTRWHVNRGVIDPDCSLCTAIHL